MGYLLKEALKTLCGVNQWSYAVFWKIGYQNPKLLIWEECYYEPIMYGGQPGSSGVQNSEMGFEDWISAEACDPQLGIRAGNGIHLLVNKMMMDNHVNVLGEGLVGRAAFTGSHQWILLENCRRDAHPPEVLKEVCQQFSAGMQTIVVIPVLPHGVVQLGSHMPIMENVAFVNDVKTLVLQLGCVPGVLLSENYSTKEPVPPKIGVPVCTGNSFTVNCSETSLVYNSTPFNAEICDYKSNLTQTAAYVGQTSCSIGQDPDVKHSAAAMFRASDLVGQNPVASHDDQCQAKIDMSANKQCPSTSQLANGVAKAEVISSNPEVWLNQQTSVCIPRSTFDRQTPIGLLDINGNGDKFVAQQISSSIGSQGNMNRGFNVTVVNHSSACNLQTTSSVTEYPSADNKFIGIDLVDVNGRLDNCFNQALGVQIYKQDEITSLSECIPGLDQKDKKHDYGVQNLSLGDACAPHRSGDDLFDILGVDFRNKLLNCSWDNVQNSVCDSNITQLDKNNSTLLKGSDASTDLYPINQGLSDSSIFSVTSADHLLDAVISSIHPSEKQNLDDTMSCRTTLTTTSSSSVPNASRSCSRVGASGQLQGDLFSFPKSLAKSGSLSSCSFRSGPGKDNKASYSNSGSLYGSQISSWIEHQDVKPSSSVSTAYSKKPDEVSKTNRKRLKPGENPRPRPKDRQMIQDRVKELREIVPNGAKCSIDALLERTIKHMLFLQSVTKHADKLKQTGDSKIIGKEGGLLTKDNYDGGATWAYEVGSQSLVCPIIVEDLNQPRQMLVEMLCEERGLFLEIADIIRGLGLTILKGVMETRNDKIWARFAVEANRDVTRMEIFISLVRLLEQTAKNGVLPTNCIDNDSMMVHQFQQATSIPASGRPCDLQ